MLTVKHACTWGITLSEYNKARAEQCLEKAKKKPRKTFFVHKKVTLFSKNVSVVFDR